MPRYEFWDTKSKSKVMVERSIEERNTPPTLEESEMKEETYSDANWERVYNTAGWTRGPEYRGSKGNWGNGYEGK